MEADDLLCSRNARSRTPLVGRAQWKINQPPSLRDVEQAWWEHLYCFMRAVKNNLPAPPEGVEESEGLRPPTPSEDDDDLYPYPCLRPWTYRAFVVRWMEFGSLYGDAVMRIHLNTVRCQHGCAEGIR